MASVFTQEEPTPRVHPFTSHTITIVVTAIVMGLARQGGGTDDATPVDRCAAAEAQDEDTRVASP